MSTSIEWTNETWNPIRARHGERVGWHCEKVTGGCKNCYAAKLNKAARFGQKAGTGLEYKAGHTGSLDIFVDVVALAKPLGWKKPRRIFVCSMTDLFGDFHSDEMIDRVFAIMALCRQHTFQVLTKRPERMRAYLDRRAESVREQMENGPGWSRFAGLEWPLPNVWLGVSVEDQETAAARIPVLLETPAACRFISAEPLIGPVDLGLLDDGGWTLAALTGVFVDPNLGGSHGVIRHGPSLDWVIVGGESGPAADVRRMHPDWVRRIRDDCAAAGVAFFFKQWGTHDAAGEPVGKKAAGDRLDGAVHHAWPTEAA